MSKNDVFEMERTVVAVLPSTVFKVKLTANGQIIVAHVSGKIRMNTIRILPGDRVTVEISAADVTKGRIIWRNK